MRIRDGWYDTGDMGIMDNDGYLWHRGRLKRFVKIGGEMVSLVRIENELEQLLPPDTDFCVAEAPDPIKGARLVVAVTTDIDEQRIIRELAGRLPRIAVPNRFLRFDSLPHMGSGKVDFRAVTVMVRERLSGE
jgi:acyl-[acyl-carrier-protein]-phospholipid O-acyltransferase / long-chain-fatty-acid--[acyl-carrier-protein] ligase